MLSENPQVEEKLAHLFAEAPHLNSIYTDFNPNKDSRIAILYHLYSFFLCNEGFNSEVSSFNQNFINRLTSTLNTLCCVDSTSFNDH
jgi:hypothetical protein